MNVICPSCSTVYRVDPAKVPERGVRARCRICAAIFQVPAPGEQSVTAERELPREIPRQPEPVVAAAPAPAPTPPAPSPPPAPETRAPEPPAPRVTAPRPVAPGSPRPSVAIPPVVAPPPRTSGTDFGRPPAAVPPAARPAAPPAGAAPAATKRPVNPFMSQDPQQKARRLARALISDLVVYYPDRRQEGLRKGNLKEVFGEEIKKSWEEYRDQVGKDIADGTSYFNDALNEILAGGQKIW
jgi:predicted Zn finger-like uncharacterized protein